MKKNLLLFLLVFNLSLEAHEERFPVPTSAEVESANLAIIEMGKQEVMSLPCRVLSQFLWDRYIRGPSTNFHYYGANPLQLTQEQALLPATILLHSLGSNQGQWLPLLHSIEDFRKNGHLLGPIFTFNFEQNTDLAQLMHMIEHIRQLYLEAGVDHVDINLVGHSLGAITSADYAFSPEIWVEKTTVKKVISIAGRLRNVEPPTDTPYYAYCYDIMLRLDGIWEKIERRRGIVELYTIAAENDWLIPEESVLVGDDSDHKAIIPGKGHVLVAYSHKTRTLVIKWLYGE